MTLLRSFAKNSIEKNDRIFLMLVFLYSPERPDKNNNNDFFKDVKQLALQISKKYKVSPGQSRQDILSSCFRKIKASLPATSSGTRCRPR